MPVYGGRGGAHHALSGRAVPVPPGTRTTREEILSSPAIPRRRSRGRAATALVAALLAAVLLAACTDGRPVHRAAPGDSRPRAGGQVIYLNEKLLDGYQQQLTGSWHVGQVWNQVVERLFYGS